MSLPIDAILDAIRDRLNNGPNLVLQAPPGAGKTTQVPLALLDQPWLSGRRILMLEPRRLAARAAATRMAGQLGEAVGATVGYQIRFERCICERTRIEVLTEGILTRRLQTDPLLEDVGLVIFDEFHERSLHADLGLALCLDSQAALRPDLRLLVMSATLDDASVARLLNGAPVVTGHGRSHPVTVHYLSHGLATDPATAAARTVPGALAEQAGDVLVFLPGAGEIRKAHRQLAGIETVLLPLYGELPWREQQRALQPDPDGRRKVVLASAIAETSLTIEGVGAVIDAGWSRRSRFDPNTGLSRLETVRVSRDSADQRAGRAGRLGPGLCYRLWSETTQQRLISRQPPEILVADLAPLVLELALWGAPPEQLAWLDPPPPAALAQARDLLRSLDALDAQGRITIAGRQLAEQPLHPRLAHLLVQGGEWGFGPLACDLAALLEERDPLRGDDHRTCDIDTRLAALRAWRDQRYMPGLDRAGAGRIDRASRQLQRRLPRSDARPVETGHATGLLLALAYPERIAQRRAGAPDRYRLAQGRGARLPADDPLTGRDWLVAAHLDDSGSEGRIHLAATLDPDDLSTTLADHLRECETIAWDDATQAVLARREWRLGALTLTRRSLTDADPAQVRAALCEGICRMGPTCLPWTETLRQWQARVLTLHHWCPEAGWPDLSDTRLAATLEDWLAPWLDGCSRREHLARLDLAGILQHRLGWPLAQRLHTAAPTHLTVPSGSRVRLRYHVDGEPPVLAVKLQELFGLTETPRLAEGHIPVVLHLLSPARRPIQITRDLRGFWENTYPEVRKELKGRYPKHPWPDDPWTATPTRGTRTQPG